MFIRVLALVTAAILAVAAAPSTQRADPQVIRAHQSFLASSELRGRGSATKDEAVAALYVATRFQEYGLSHAPGLESFLQSLPVPATDWTRQRGLPADSRTVNVIGYLEGNDPSAGTILITAHLDHLGIVDGAIHAGANDDASGTTAVLELARLLAAGPRLQRSILFVCYGAEELGAVGSHYFAQHSPVPLANIIANIEFEMIGNADPKLGKGLMMTGFGRSNLGALLNAHGAAVGEDPYPDQHFFERSDNYELALAGVVAHTISGWPLVPVYHTAGDTNEQIDFAFMTSAIQSLVDPIRWLANSDVKPAWVAGGRPSPRR